MAPQPIIDHANVTITENCGPDGYTEGLVGDMMVTTMMNRGINRKRSAGSF